MNLKSPSQPLSFHESILSAKSKPDTVLSVEGTAGNQINKDPCPMELSLQWMRPEINKINNQNIWYVGKSLVVQRLGLRDSTAGGTGSIPVRGTRIPQTSWPKNKTKKHKIYGTLQSRDQ